ncbi:SRPBCC family protein [Portibacter marinus]|uniref:SRPBCC family protein n=1 Tax=Portibacter marinus TaxID=2898660 RepID=UPI001F363E9A|nr:SRPBCC domain-containing protein [Portibacter marinus]
MKNNSYNLYHDFVIKSSPSKVFDSIVKPENLINWWPQKCNGEPKHGAIYRLYFSSQYDWLAEVVGFELKKSFYLKMIKADTDWMPTTFGFDLKEENGNTLVQFFHKGWPKLNHHFRKANWHWALLLKALKDYVEEETIIPFEHRA